MAPYQQFPACRWNFTFPAGKGLTVSLVTFNALNSFDDLLVLAEVQDGKVAEISQIGGESSGLSYNFESSPAAAVFQASSADKFLDSSQCRMLITFTLYDLPPAVVVPTPIPIAPAQFCQYPLSNFSVALSSSGTTQGSLVSLGYLDGQQCFLSLTFPTSAMLTINVTSFATQLRKDLLTITDGSGSIRLDPLSGRFAAASVYQKNLTGGSVRQKKISTDCTWIEWTALVWSIL